MPGFRIVCAEGYSREGFCGLCVYMFSSRVHIPHASRGRAYILLITLFYLRLNLLFTDTGVRGEDGSAAAAAAAVASDFVSLRPFVDRVSVVFRWLVDVDALGSSPNLPFACFSLAGSVEARLIHVSLLCQLRLKDSSLGARSRWVWWLEPCVTSENQPFSRFGTSLTSRTRMAGSETQANAAVISSSVQMTIGT